MKIIKNRGAISNPTGRYEDNRREDFDDGWDHVEDEEFISTLRTTVLIDSAKTVITRNKSPDLGFEQSINPYRGCEHGCIYCYARPSHGYMNLSSGLDFETKIFYKPDAAKVLETELCKPSYICKTIMFGANTDPYQPLERKLKTSRSILEVLNRFNHPVSVITKNSMIERDIDILSDMAQRNLARVALSITSLSNDLKNIMEPRTSAPKARIAVVRKLAEAGIPVSVMVAPIIPMINDFELEKILEAIKDAGAEHVGYVLIRLPHEVKDLFKEWLEKHFPDRASHVMSIIKQMRGGKEYDATFGKRFRGEGEFANLLETRFTIACKRLGLNQKSYPALDKTKFKAPRQFSPQLDLFENLK